MAKSLRMELSSIIALAFALLTMSTSGQEVLPQDHDSYTVCQNFKGTFTPTTDRGHIGIGRQGKRGAKGEKGSLGNVEESEIIQDLASRLQAITDCNGLYRKGVCYFLLEEKVTHDVAVSRCQAHGGRLVVIDSRQLYGAIMSFVYHGIVRFSSPTYLQFWMAGVCKNQAVTLPDGRTAPFLLWYPSYPRAPASEIHMAFEVKRDNQMDSHQHMFNIHAQHRAYTLCQKP